MLEELALNCGTPSMYVVTPGLFGLELMPRNRALLSLRADQSVMSVFGAKIAASPTESMRARSSVPLDTAVRLAGTVWAFSGTFAAVTVMVGSWNRSASWLSWLSCAG